MASNEGSSMDMTIQEQLDSCLEQLRDDDGSLSLAELASLGEQVGRLARREMDAQEQAQAKRGQA
jgi:hypothetical protein